MLTSNLSCWQRHWCLSKCTWFEISVLFFHTLEDFVFFMLNIKLWEKQPLVWFPCVFLCKSELFLKQFNLLFVGEWTCCFKYLRCRINRWWCLRHYNAAIVIIILISLPSFCQVTGLSRSENYLTGRSRLGRNFLFFYPNKVHAFQCEIVRIVTVYAVCMQLKLYSFFHGLIILSQVKKNSKA